MRAPDCSPAPRTFFLAPPDRRMDALWIGNCRLLHPISPYAGTGGLPARSPLFNVLGQLRSVCLLSFPLAPVYPVSFCPVSISGIFVHSGGSMHRRISSHDTPLERAPDTPQLEYGRRPGIRRLRSFSSHGAHFTSGSSITVPSRSRGVDCWRQKRRRARPNFRRCVTNCSLISCFNTLNAISSLVVSKQPERATEMIAKLAALLRNTLSFPEAHVVTLREELAVTEEYLSIEQVRFGPRLAVSLSVSPEASEAQVPRFLLQPIVENAIRHGIARCPNGGEVSITASVIEGQLRIDIENDRTEGLLPLR